MDGYVVKFVGAAAVVQMGVGDDEEWVPLEHFRDRGPQRYDAEAGIDHNVSVSADPPDVCSKEWVDVRFGDPHQVWGDCRHRVPSQPRGVEGAGV